MATFIESSDVGSTDTSLFHDKQLIMASLTLANVPQLALDVLVQGGGASTQRYARCGVVEHAELLPIVASVCGASSNEPGAVSSCACTARHCRQQSLLSACEVYRGEKDTKNVVLQRRAPTRPVKHAAQRFAAALVTLAAQRGIKRVLLAHSGPQAAPHAKSDWFFVFCIYPELCIVC
jgi:hypothetical protein